MRHSAGNFVIAVGSMGVGSVTPALTHFNVFVGTLAGLVALAGASFSAINGYYTWRRNRKEAAREAEEDRRKLVNDRLVNEKPD